MKGNCIRIELKVVVVMNVVNMLIEDIWNWQDHSECQGAEMYIKFVCTAVQITSFQSLLIL
jgi:hypothetical protein